MLFVRYENVGTRWILHDVFKIHSPGRTYRITTIARIHKVVMRRKWISVIDTENWPISGCFRSIVISTEKAINLIVNGYCKDVLNQLPMEFAVEAQKLLEISLEGSVG